MIYKLPPKFINYRLNLRRAVSAEGLKIGGYGHSSNADLLTVNHLRRPIGKKNGGGSTAVLFPLFPSLRRNALAEACGGCGGYEFPPVIARKLPAWGR